MGQLLFEDLKQLGVTVLVMDADISGLFLYIFQKGDAEFKYAVASIEMTPDLEPKLAKMAADALCLFSTFEEGAPDVQ